MTKFPGAFTLIEVMLAVAIFAFAAVGFSVALNEVLSINTEMTWAVQKRQALESVAAEILATTNNVMAAGAAVVPGWGAAKQWQISQATEFLPPITVPGPNNSPVNLQGWWQVRLQVEEKQGGISDKVSFLLWTR